MEKTCENCYDYDKEDWKYPCRCCKNGMSPSSPEYDEAPLLWEGHCDVEDDYVIRVNETTTLSVTHKPSSTRKFADVLIGQFFIYDDELYVKIGIDNISAYAMKLNDFSTHECYLQDEVSVVTAKINIDIC